MINFPQSTLFNRRIPKQKFYEKLDVSSGLERLFVKEIETIVWKHKLAPDTINISAGESVAEIQVIEIALKEQSISRSILEAIDREIPYHLIFTVRYRDLGQIWVAYKEMSKRQEGKFKVETYYCTEWQSFDSLSLEITGLDLDKVYANFLNQVSGGKLHTQDGGDLREAIARDREREKLEAQARSLEAKMHTEKQYNQKVRLMGELRKLRAQLDSFK